MHDELIVVPSFLGDTISTQATDPCDYCEIACETDAMVCGECSGQTCAAQCPVCEGACQTVCEKGCQTVCEKSCQSVCEKACQAVCELSAQGPTYSVATFYITDITHQSATVVVAAGSGYTQMRVYAREDPDPGWAVLDTGEISMASGRFPISGLSPSTSYVVNVFNIASDGTTVLTGIQPFETLAKPFVTFDWTYAGLDSSGNPVAGVEKRSGLGVYITSGEWNTLVGLVNGVRGTSLSTVSPGMTISASTVNLMANALGVGTVSPGQDISASFFNQLRSAYNNLV